MVIASGEENRWKNALARSAIQLAVAPLACRAKLRCASRGERHAIHQHKPPGVPPAPSCSQPSTLDAFAVYNLHSCAQFSTGRNSVLTILTALSNINPRGE